jgi:phosphoglycolate phosphatase-like HAD superfamily hydrolase
VADAGVPIPIMKNANIFVDVDLTLIDANSKMLPGAPEALKKLVAKSCHLFLWSTNGADYAQRVAKIHGIETLFEGFSAKPDIIIDDMPGTALNPFVFDVNAEASWQSLAEKIIGKHID